MMMKKLSALGLSLLCVFGGNNALAQDNFVPPSPLSVYADAIAAPMPQRVWSEPADVEQTQYSPDAGSWVAPSPMPYGPQGCDVGGCVTGGYMTGGCDIACDMPCDVYSADSCDGFGGYGDCDSGFCLCGGHDDPFDFSDDVLGWEDRNCLDFGGWTQFGYHNQSTGLFNDHPGRFNNHQTWLYFEKEADGNFGIDWGFRVDLMYGVDAQDTQAFGNTPGEWDFQNNGYDHGIYGWAAPQAYFDIAYRDLSIRIGHFYTLLGYEVVTAPDNFFYSHAFTMYNAEAFTHSGVLATYTASDDVTLYGGWTQGWDTGFDSFDKGSSFLGGASLVLTEGLTATFITTAGDFGKIGDGYSHSLVIDAALTDTLNYVFQSDYLHTSDANFGPGTETEAYGINQYLTKEITDWLALGGRMEWWKADSVSYYGITGGINLKPCGNLTIRPEVRYQWSPAADDFTGAATGNNPAGLPVNDGATFGVDAIFTF